MPYKKISLFVFITVFTALSPCLIYSNEIYTEVIITVKDEKILAFSAYKNHWVSESIKLSERIISKRSQGNIGIVVTTKRILGFSVITDQWTTEGLKMNEEPGEIIVEGNVATINTNERVIGFSAHTGQWIEAP